MASRYSRSPYPAFTHNNGGVLTMSESNVKMMGNWHPTVVYLLALLFLEITAVGFIRVYWKG